MDKFETPIYQQSEEQEELFDICKITLLNGIVIFSYFKLALSEQPTVQGMKEYLIVKRNRDEKYCRMYCRMMNNIDKKCLVLNVATDQMSMVHLVDVVRGEYNEHRFILMSEFMDRDKEVSLMKTFSIKEYEDLQEADNKFVMQA